MNFIFYKRGLLSCQNCFTIEKELLQLKHKSSSAFGEVEVAAITSKLLEARETPAKKVKQESCRSEINFAVYFAGTVCESGWTATKTVILVGALSDKDELTLIKIQSTLF
ncbi:hypothetical protein HB912_00780 [Listeria aquatica]|uniref:Uncharacterized protein n=1 Tax=Listeria aquatica TaxID=1494960 RepID=A0A841ZL54_9LIST|nr:hypothetical protein [Listeria aquatica]